MYSGEVSILKLLFANNLDNELKFFKTVILSNCAVPI